MLYTYTRRAMTQEEIDALKASKASSLTDADAGKALLAVFRVLYGIAQQIQPGITVPQFRTFVENEASSNDIPADAFREWLEARL